MFQLQKYSPKKYEDRMLTNDSLGLISSMRTDEMTVEVFENEHWSCIAPKGWVPEKVSRHWTFRDGKPARPLEELPVPEDQCWSSNWKVSFDGEGVRDTHGWEYATRYKRFTPYRLPRTQRWRDTARRRRWVRKAVPAETSSFKRRGKLDDAPSLTLPEIQKCLQGLLRARQNAERLATLLGGPKDSWQLRQKLDELIKMIDEHRTRVRASLERLENKKTAKKLQNDLAREEAIFTSFKRKIEQKKQDYLFPSYTDDGSGKNELKSQQISFGKLDNNSFSFKSRPQKSQLDSLGQDGDYISRDSVERLVLQSLQKQDEVAVNDEIITERNIAIQEVLKSMVELNEVFRDFASIVVEQKAEVDKLDATMTEVYEQTACGYQQIVEAQRGQTRSCSLM